MSQKRSRDVQFFIDELQVIETGEFNDLFLRPYRTNMNSTVKDTLEQKLATSNNRFTPSVLASIANQFIVPDQTPRGLVQIPGGWSERRGRFVMIVNLRFPTGEDMVQMLIGYTENREFSTKHIDHRMLLTVNNSFTMIKKQRRMGNGQYETYYVPNNPKDILADRDSGGLRRRSDRLFTIRPEDIFSVRDANNIDKLVDDMTDLRTTLSRGAVTSSSRNRISSNFMSRVVDSRRKAIENNEDFANSTVDIDASAQGYVAEDTAINDMFLRHMSHNIRDLNYISDSFTYGDLLDLDPTIDERASTNLLDDNSRAATRYTEYTNPLDGQEEIDQIAAIIGVAVPALMMECGIARIGFQAHNEDPVEKYTFLPTNVSAFINDADLTPFVDRFEERLIDELIVPITADSRWTVAMQVKASVHGVIEIKLYFDGVQNPDPYVYPCFSGALYSPVLTDNADDVKRVTKAFGSLFDEFQDTLGETRLTKSSFNF